MVGGVRVDVGAYLQGHRTHARDASGDARDRKVETLVTIDKDVERIAKSFGVDPELIQSVVTAEGDILAAVRCSVPTADSRDEAIAILCRSAGHAMSDFIHDNCAATFVAFWGARWAPVGVKNDPKGLNKNWDKNVDANWPGITKQAKKV